MSPSVSGERLLQAERTASTEQLRVKHPWRYEGIAQRPVRASEIGDEAQVVTRRWSPWSLWIVGRTVDFIWSEEGHERV